MIGSWITGRRWWLSPLTAAAAVMASLWLAAPAAAADAPLPPQPPQRALLAAAYAAIDADDFDRAETIARDLEDPLAAKLVRWTRLIAQRQGGDFEDYVAFLRDNPDWPWQYTLQYRAEGAMPSDLPDSRVRAFFADRKPVSPYGKERYADALISAGLDDAARAMLRFAWLSDDFPYEDEKRFQARYGHLIDENLDRMRLDRLIWEGQLSAAERQLKRVDQGYRALARARIKLLRMAPGVDGAIAAVPDELRDDPGLVYARARWRLRKDRYRDVVELLDPPRPEAPYPEVWWNVRHWTARTALDRGDISLAYRLAANHGLEEGLGFAQGEWLAGWIALRFLKEPESAYPHFTRLHAGVSTPVSRARGAYWAGRAAEAADRQDEARRWYETAAGHLTTFYGQLAAARLGDSSFLALPRPPQPGPAEQRAFNSRQLVQAVRLLGRYGLAERADRILMDLSDHAKHATTARMVADLADAVDRPDLAVKVAREARRRGMILPDHLYPTVPLAEGTLPARDDRRTALLLAIVRQESSFDIGAVSHAGARGLMQLMPGTARQIAGHLDVAYSRERLVSDASYNLRLGHAYIGQLIDRYDGSLLLAVAAYNAGPSRVSRWLGEYGDPRTGFVDAVDWVEMLPYAETRNYIQRVFESLMVYRHRLAPTEVAMALDHHLLLQAGAPRLGSSPVSCCL